MSNAAPDVAIGTRVSLRIEPRDAGAVPLFTPIPEPTDPTGLAE